jgi:RecA-family ATPase
VSAAPDWVADDVFAAGRPSENGASGKENALTAPAAGTTGGPFAVALDEFIASRSDAPSVLVGDENENVLPAAGLLILFAKGGRGKTTLTVDGAFHLASGVEWLGFQVPRPLRVLIAENEGPREPFRQKLAIKRQLWQHEILGEIFIYVEDWGSLLLSPDSILRLRRFIEEHQMDLVIGDPLDSVGIRGVGSPEDTREFCKLLVAAGLTRDVAFWLLHHPRKADADDELDEVSGAWGGRVGRARGAGAWTRSSSSTSSTVAARGSRSRRCAGAAAARARP